MSQETGAILEELVSIKRLIIFALLQQGYSQAQVATALGTSQSQISRMFPAKSK
jgi:predicted transcriptional regulator